MMRLLLALLLVLASCRGGVDAETRAEMLRAATTAHPGGHALYLQHCAGCHGLQAGGGLAPALVANPRASNAVVVETVLRQGQGAMPAFENHLNDETIMALTDFVVALTEYD